MSSESSASSIRQFGLYRTIDARTEEFLRLSRKRQLRQGCICAAISTAITVIVVIVVLLIYEYMIVVETYGVQNVQTKYRLISDKPIADRLDRSYFGFDQDYFERMPLLINALQENSYVDPTADNVSVPTIRKKQRSQSNTVKPKMSHHIYKSIRRTTPRPFVFEYRSPNPTPFSKNFNSRSWIESYRNAQRLQNLNQVIKYLEKTLNAKFGNIYEPSSAQIAFSGVYVAPLDKIKTKTPDDCQESQGSQKVEYKSNHISDPLYVFKPDNPGDINLLADGYRFSPYFQSRMKNSIRHVPMFRPISQNKGKCVGDTCDSSDGLPYTSSINVDGTHTTPLNNPKAFGVIYNVYPAHTTKSDDSLDTKSTSSIDQIYLTTSRPSYQFKKKPNHKPVRRTSFRPRMPKILATKRNPDVKTTQTTSNIETTTEPKVVVHFNVYSIRKNPVPRNDLKNSYSSTSTTPTPVEIHKYDVHLPIINSSIVEDYHVGSSGIIPVVDRTPPVYPITTPIIPQFDQEHYLTDTTTTNAPDIIKFNPEDAKVPDEYFNLRKSDISMMNESDLDTKDEDISEAKLTETTKSENIESKMLIIKLKNILKTTTETPTTVVTTEEYYSTTDEDYKTTESTTETTGETYVPMINGHYRSTKRKTLNVLFNENSEKYRKRRLETSISFQRSTYVPMYVEIKRNRTNASTEND